MAVSRPLSWAVILKNARKRGHFSGFDKEEALQWSTCAVGEIRSSRTTLLQSGKYKPKRKRGVAGGVDDHSFWLHLNNSCPDDETLNFLGMEFCYAVREDNVGKATELYDKIEARVLEFMRGEVTDEDGKVLSLVDVLGGPMLEPPVGSR